MATKTEKNVQLKINKMTKNIFDQLSVQGLISEDELYLLSDDETGSAKWGTIGGELSNQTDLKIMLDSKVDKSIYPAVLSAYALSSDVDARLSQKADKSEIPTVNNPTITFTQGNAVKGSITLNQANDQTISLDAGGGGGGDIPADFIPYDINNSAQTGSYIHIGGTYTNWNRGIYCFEVETDSSFIIKYQFKNPYSGNYETVEYYLNIVDTAETKIHGAVITIPCLFDPGVVIFNDYSYDMTVREFYRIEFKDFYS